MQKHTITRSPARPRSLSTPQRQTRRPTRRPAAPLILRPFWLVLWHLRRGTVRPRLALLSVGLVWSLVLWLGLANVLKLWPVAQAAPVQHARPTPQPVSSSVAQKVPALYQGDPGIGWDSPKQYQTWWPSSCSAVALTADLRAWGTNVGVGVVLDRLWTLGAISADNGLTDASALSKVAESFGYQARTFWHWSAQDVTHMTAQGVPVLVLLVDAKQQTPYPGFVVGHWLVVTSVSPDQITVRDSSGYHIHSLSPAVFHTLFTGIGTVLWRGQFDLPKEG
jgi:hypothetical protein